MRTRPATQLTLTDSFQPAAPANDFLDRLDVLVDWQPIAVALAAKFTATTGRLPQPPLVVLKMLLLQACYGPSDPQCEDQVRDHLSWRRFTGLSLTDPVPDETTLVRFRQRLVAHGLHVRLLDLVNQQCAAHSLLVTSPVYRTALVFMAAASVPFAFTERPLLVIVAFTVIGSLFIPFLAATLLWLNNRVPFPAP